MRLQIGNRGYVDRAVRDERASSPALAAPNAAPQRRPGGYRITFSALAWAAQQAGGTHGTSVPFSKGCAQLVYRV
jgi:hypothetical protein